ncbi:MAG: flagellar hook-associated protein FlgL [Fibrobacterales bacterium]
MSRVTFTHINNVVQRNLQNNYSKLADTQEQLSSGKRITRPSDAPIDITNDLELRSGISTKHQYVRNTQDAESYLLMVDATLNSSNNVLQSIRERAIQGANSTNTAVEREYIAREVRQLLYQMVSVSNSTYKGDFLFSGTNTDKQPYVVESSTEEFYTAVNDLNDNTEQAAGGMFPGSTHQLFDRDLNDGQNTPNLLGYPEVKGMVPGTVTITGLTENVDYTINYPDGTITFIDDPGNPGNLTANAQAAQASGFSIDYEWIRRSEHDMTGSIMRQLDESVTGQINLIPDEIFGKINETDLFESINIMLYGLEQNDPIKIEESITDIDAAFERLLSAQATAGARTNKITAGRDRLADKIIESTRIQSELEDLDFAEAISRFQLQESVYQASLQSASKVLQPTLANYV